MSSFQGGRKGGGHRGRGEKTNTRPFHHRRTNAPTQHVDRPTQKLCWKFALGECKHPNCDFDHSITKAMEIPVGASCFSLTQQYDIPKIWCGNNSGNSQLYNLATNSIEDNLQFPGWNIRVIEAVDDYLFIGGEAPCGLVPGINVGRVLFLHMRQKSQVELEANPWMPFAHTKSVRAMIFCPPDCLLTGGEEGLIRLWGFDGNTFALRMTFEGHLGSVNGFALLGSILWSVSDDVTMRCWDLPSTAGVQIITKEIENSHTAPIRTITSFSFQDGQYFVTGSDDLNIKVWNSTGGFMMGSNQRETVTAITTLQVPNGVLFVIGINSGTILIRNIDMDLIYALKKSEQKIGHFRPICGLTSGPNNTILSVDEEKVIVWMLHIT